MSIDAMKQALEALEGLRDLFYQDTIEALRAAITEAERQEPVAKWDETRGVADRLGLAKIADETLLYTTPQHAIPDGWQLVPVEPTPEMLFALAADCAANYPGCPNPVVHVIHMDSRYKAMLTAAPKSEK